MKYGLCDLVGKYSWGWQITIGTCLMIDFGDPILKIKDPIEDDLSNDGEFSRLGSRRFVRAVGENTLLIPHHGWVVVSRFGKIDVGNRFDPKNLNNIILDLDGQKVKRYKEMDDFHLFEFDLDGKLMIKKSIEEGFSMLYNGNNYFRSLDFP